MNYKTYFKEQIKKYPEYIDTVQMMQMCKIGKNTIYKWRNMNSVGYKVKWTEERKNVTFTTPNGMPVRDYKLGFSKDFFENSFKSASKVQQSFFNNLRYICSSAPTAMDFPCGVIPPDLSGMSDDEIRITLSKFYTDLESHRCQVAAYNQEQQENQQKLYQIESLLDMIDNALQNLEVSVENEDDDDLER